jgi:hypothetical protein
MNGVHIEITHLTQSSHPPPEHSYLAQSSYPCYIHLHMELLRFVVEIKCTVDLSSIISHSSYAYVIRGGFPHAPRPL